MGGARMKQGGQVILSAIRRGPEKGRGWLSSALGSWAADDDDVIGGTKKLMRGVSVACIQRRGAGQPTRAPLHREAMHGLICMTQ